MRYTDGWLDKEQFAFSTKGSVETGYMAKVLEVGAAAHGHMLAIVDQFASRSILKRACSPTKPRPRLQQRDLLARLRQGHTRRQPRQSSSDHDHVAHAEIRDLASV